MAVKIELEKSMDYKDFINILSDFAYWRGMRVTGETNRRILETLGGYHDDLRGATYAASPSKCNIYLKEPNGKNIIEIIDAPNYGAIHSLKIYQTAEEKSNEIILQLVDRFDKKYKISSQRWFKRKHEHQERLPDFKNEIPFL